MTGPDDMLAKVRAAADEIDTARYPYVFSDDPIQNRRDEVAYLTDEPKLINTMYQASLRASRARRRLDAARKHLVYTVCVLAGALVGAGAALLVFAH